MGSLLSRDRLIVDVMAHGFKVIMADGIHLGNVIVADKLAALPVVSRREWLDLDAQPNIGNVASRVPALRG